MTTGSFILSMLIYSITGGIYIGVSVGYFGCRKFIRGGIAAMIALSFIFLMAECVFGGAL